MQTLPRPETVTHRICPQQLAVPDRRCRECSYTPEQPGPGTDTAGGRQKAASTGTAGREPGGLAVKEKLDPRSPACQRFFPLPLLPSSLPHSPCPRLPCFCPSCPSPGPASCPKFGRTVKKRQRPASCGPLLQIAEPAPPADTPGGLWSSKLLQDDLRWLLLHPGLPAPRPDRPEPGPLRSRL